MDLGIPYFPNSKVAELPETAQRLWALWKQASVDAGGIIPKRSAIRAVDLGEYAASCFIAERTAPCDFVFRMSGTGFDALFGASLTGQPITAIAHGEGHQLLKAFCEAVVAKPCGAFVRDLMVTNKGEHILSEGLTMPLTDNQGEIKFIICVSNITSQGFSGDEAPKMTQSDYRKIQAAYFIHLEDEA